MGAIPPTRPGADHRFPAQHRRVRVNRDVVFHIRMTFASLANMPPLVALKAASTQGHAVKQFHVRADLARLADHHAGPVIDEKMGPDLRPWMNVDAGSGVGPFRHEARDQRHVLFI